MTLVRYIGCILLFSNFAFGAQEEIPPLRPPRPELHPSFWSRHGWLIVIAVLFVFAALAFWLSWLRRPKPRVVTPPDVLARSVLQGLRDRGQDAALVAEVSRVFRQYIISAFNLPADELTSAEVEKTLQSQSKTSPEMVAAITDFLRHCDEWKFAPNPSAAQLGAVERALALLEKIETQRRDKLNQPPTANVAS